MVASPESIEPPRYREKWIPDSRLRALRNDDQPWDAAMLTFRRDELCDIT
jgi:hypothetical protein